LPGWKDVLILQIFLTDIPRMSEPRVTHDDLVHCRMLTLVVLGMAWPKTGRQSSGAGRVLNFDSGIFGFGIQIFCLDPDPVSILAMIYIYFRIFLRFAKAISYMFKIVSIFYIADF
jgi:hypothetical protein